MVWFIRFGKLECVESMHYKSTMRGVPIRKCFSQQSRSHVTFSVSQSTASGGTSLDFQGTYAT